MTSLTPRPAGSRQVSPLSINRRARATSDAVLSPESHPAFHFNRVALITGGANGIGFAAAKELLREGLKVILADIDEEQLKIAERELADEFGEPAVLAIKTDVSKLEDVERLKDRVIEQFGEVNILMNNAGVGNGPDGKTGTAWTNIDAWRKVLDVNLWGVINMLQVFTPLMSHNENPSLIINTGSKQGITNPPGNAVYNVSKAGVKVLTENLAHELRAKGSKLTAHLFVPGWTFTSLGGNKDPNRVKPEGAWTPEETVQYLFPRVKEGYFYIICPDNETTPELDKLRMSWAAEDVSEGRPALSRWHPEYKPVFEEYISQNLKRE